MPIIGEVPMSKYLFNFQSSPALHFYLFFFLLLIFNLTFLKHNYEGSKSHLVFYSIQLLLTVSFNPFLVYFIPECGEEYGRLKKLIE